MWSELFSTIKEDYTRFIISDQTTGAKVLFFTQGFWAVLNYRIAREIYTKVKIPVLRWFLLVPMFFWRKLTEITTNIYLPWTAEIGKSLHISHFGFLVVHPRAILGDYCSLSQGVTIGVKPDGKYSGVPKIGKRVYIAPNAVLIGGIDVGDDAVVGAGSIVTRPVPPRAVVAGNPAEVISFKGSFNLIRYEGMDFDTDRSSSLALCSELDSP